MFIALDRMRRETTSDRSFASSTSSHRVTCSPHVDFDSLFTTKNLDQDRHAQGRIRALPDFAEV
jgi:hypothetical protein